MRNPVLASGVFGLAGVVLGAFGAHALKNTLAAHGTAGTWETAVFYQLTHALALLALGAIPGGGVAPGKWLRRAALAWSAGIVLFSGSLYLVALGGPAVIARFIPPLGGGALIAGWGCVVAHAAARSGPAEKA